MFNKINLDTIARFSRTDQCSFHVTTVIALKNIIIFRARRSQTPISACWTWGWRVGVYNVLLWTFDEDLCDTLNNVQQQCKSAGRSYQNYCGNNSAAVKEQMLCSAYIQNTYTCTFDVFIGNLGLKRLEEIIGNKKYFWKLIKISKPLISIMLGV